MRTLFHCLLLAAVALASPRNSLSQCRTAVVDALSTLRPEGDTRIFASRVSASFTLRDGALEDAAPVSRLFETFADLVSGAIVATAEAEVDRVEVIGRNKLIMGGPGRLVVPEMGEIPIVITYLAVGQDRRRGRRGKSEVMVTLPNGSIIYHQPLMRLRRPDHAKVKIRKSSCEGGY